MSDTNEVARVKTHRTQAKQFRPFQLADNATLVVLAQTFARDIDILLAHIERQQAIVEAARAVVDATNAWMLSPYPTENTIPFNIALRIDDLEDVLKGEV